MDLSGDLVVHVMYGLTILIIKVFARPISTSTLTELLHLPFLLALDLSDICIFCKLNSWKNSKKLDYSSFYLKENKMF